MARLTILLMTGLFGCVLWQALSDPVVGIGATERHVAPAQPSPSPDDSFVLSANGGNSLFSTQGGGTAAHLDVVSEAPYEMPVAWTNESTDVVSDGLDVSYRYYEVTGQTLEEVRGDMARKGPLVAGRRYAGSALWQISWLGKLDPSGKVVDVRVFYSAEVTLPRWTPPENCPPMIGESWSAFVRSLDSHERGHARIVAERVGLLQSMLSGGAYTEEELDTFFDLEGARIDEMQADYDEETGHGATQGCSL